MIRVVYEQTELTARESVMTDDPVISRRRTSREQAKSVSRFYADNIAAAP
jgi:hypothetical protein